MGDVVLLFGGASSERLVSVASAQNVSRHLPSARPFFLAPTGPVHEVSTEALQRHQGPFERPFEPTVPARWASLEEALDSLKGSGCALFLALHGGAGEDGSLQRLLEARGLPFTGSGSRASADAFDKERAKALAAAAGARVAGAQALPVCTPAEATHLLAQLLRTHPRWVLKPRCDGSSHGLLQLRGEGDIGPAAAVLGQLATPYLAEHFIEGRELTVGVVEEVSGPVALPVSEVQLQAGAAFDYQGKYLGKGTREVTPAELEDGARQAAQALALLTHRAVGCAGYSRTDMILTAAGPVLLEINTLPGLSQASFIPQQLAAAGSRLDDFLRWQLQLARARTDGARSPG